MDKEDEYRARAATAVPDAETTANPDDKKLLLRIASAWEDLAEGRPVILDAEFARVPDASRPYSERN